MNENIKLSIWSSYYVDLSPKEAIDEIARCGYRYTELSDEHTDMLLAQGDPRTVGAEFGAYAAQKGVTVSQGHLFLKAHITKEEDLAILKEQIELFCAIGIRSAVLHCDGLPELGENVQRERNAAGLRVLLDAIGDRDLCICLENLRIHHGSVEELLSYVEELNSPHLGICLDTGHLNLSRSSSQRDFILRAGKHLRALHIADNEGERDQHLMPFGAGSVDMKEVASTLLEIGYDGLWNLEIPGERKTLRSVRACKLAYMKAAFDCLLQEIR